ALLEHFDRAAIGLILMGRDRKVLRANEAVTSLTGITSSVLSDCTLRRFLSSEAPYDLEDRIFEEVASSGHWLGELEIRTSIGDTSPMMVSITPVGSDDGSGPAGDSDDGPASEPDGATRVRYVAAVIELGQQRWVEAESGRRAG